MLLNNSLVHEYIDRVLKDERVSLNDSMISNFVEVFYGKVNFLHEFTPKKIILPFVRIDPWQNCSQFFSLTKSN